MNISPFELERYFAKHEFTARYLLSSSDCESLSLQELLAMADSTTRELWQGLRLGYTESAGHPLLRREIANLYKSVWPDDVLVLAPEEGIFIAMNALLQRGDHAIMLAPAYQSLYEIPTSLGVEVTRWTLETDGVRWKLDLAFLERHVKPSTKLLIINFPHNPTGFHPDHDSLKRIIDFAREKKIVVFSDEMYRYLEYHTKDRLPGVCDLSEKNVALGGLSKSFALPGLRIGWLATKDQELMKKLRTLKDYTTICSSAPSEVLAIMALRARDRIIDRTLKIIEDNLGHADRFFAGYHKYFEWIVPLASAVAFPRLKGTDTIERFCDKLVESKGVMIVPGSLFDFPGNHFRIGLGRRNFPEGLKKLGEFVEETYPK
ncbi:MAG: aminotransferase class I/II-fold pyridoxal phosphate-dependent enzyme [Bacteroidota bacterium]